MEPGFSIVQWTGTGSAGTLGHGLSSAPELIMVKDTTVAYNWYVYTTATGSNIGIEGLNTSAASFAASSQMTTTNTLITNVPSIASLNTSGSAMIIYAFHSVAGYSKIGSYTGNGSTQLIETGFEPAFIIIKATSTTSDWRLYDNKRGSTDSSSSYVGNRKPLYANLDIAEGNGIDEIRFLSNGFEVGPGNNTNTNGVSFMYMVFAADQSAAPVLADSFAPDIYTGNGTNRVINTGFRPDFVWIKARSFARNHYLYDTIRGVNNQLNTNSNSGQANITNRLTAFNTGGFTLGTSSEVNNNSETYVAWSWKANPVPTINTDGTIQSVASANQAAGFSIVSFTTPATNNFTVGHGLSAAPKIMIIKGLSIVSSWTFYSSEIGATNYLQLNNTNASTASSDPFNDTAPTNSVFTLGSSTVWYGTNQNYIAYCFAEVAGFSKFGSYTGDGTSNLSKSINVGFQPDFVLVRATSATGTWLLWDSARVSGGAYYGLYPNNDVAETLWNQSNEFNIVSTGFTVGRVNNNDGYDNNNNGVNYIYMAFKIN
jgi:hypothetical protein